MVFVVRFDRQADSTGPDAASISAERYVESYHEGVLVAYRFLDVDGNEVAMVRAARVAYIARAGSVTEPAQPPIAPLEAEER
ncbi:MAG TPA: hypothetical protein VFD32_13780 [Dehalococcoidia bacterium]|nr:hypothetical protein [Dehalococcoidia bacterium]